MNKKPFQGTGTALVTPFKRDGSVDEQALRRLVDFQIDEGIDMLLPCGTTGEGATLDSAETERVVSMAFLSTDGLQVLHRPRREQFFRPDGAMRQSLLDRPSQHAINGFLVGRIAVRPDVRSHDAL